MINLKNAGATRLTLKDGGYTDWSVTLDGEELYTLPSNFTAQNTFEIRRIIEKMMDYAHKQGLEEMKAKKDSEIEQILDTGNAQLNVLIDENEKIANALEKHIISKQEDY